MYAFFQKTPGATPLIFLWMSLTAIPVYGQSFITTVSTADANLGANEAQRIQQLASAPNTAHLSLASIGDPATAANETGIFQFQVPGVEGLVQAQILETEHGPASYSVTGKLISHPGYFGFLEMSNTRAAWFQINGRLFEIMPVKPGVNTVREVLNNTPDEFDCSRAGDGPEISETFCAIEYNTCPATIDILVLITPDAISWLDTWLGDNWLLRKLYMGISIQALNTAFANSDIPNKKANFVLEPFDFNMPALISDINVLTSLVAQATARRNEIGADLVVMITGTNVPDGAGAACGQLGLSAGCDLGFAYAEINWIFNPRWTFIHEVGHLLGAGHDGYGYSPSCARGWIVGGNRFQKTIMAYWSGAETPTDVRILHYSNPDVLYNGDPSGTATHNNANAIRKGACTVAAYRQSTLFSAQIATKPYVCRSEEYIYTDAFVSIPSAFNPGQPPYAYEWRWSFTPDFTTSTYFGNGAGASFPIPEDGDHLWVQLKITTSDGQEFTLQKRIRLYFDSHPLCPVGAPRSRQYSAPGHPGFLLRPNPAGEQIDISWDAAAFETARIRVLDYLGRECIHLSLKNNDEQRTHTIKIGTLPSGAYQVALQAGTFTTFKKLIISH